MNESTLPLPGRKIRSSRGRRIWGRDGISCAKAAANQLRLFLRAGAYWLMWRLRTSTPKRPMWRVAQFDTLRLRLIKVATRIVEKTMIRVHLPTSCPDQGILRLGASRASSCKRRT